MQNGTLEYLRSEKLEFREFINTSELSSMKVGGLAGCCVVPHSIDELCNLVGYLNREDERYILIGGGTNTLFATDFFDGVLISTKSLRDMSFHNGVLVADCGVTLSSLMKFSKINGYMGAEQLSLIPGTLGGAICGNAGAHGIEISDIVLSMEVFCADTKEVRTVSAKDACFSYRSSIFKKRSDMIILSASILLSKGDLEESDRRRREYIDARARTQPIGSPSLGSVYKRVGGVSAGYYIDKAGLKGLCIGGASVSEKHAGFVVTNCSAHWQDVVKLMCIIENRVYEEFGITLEREIVVIN